MNTTYYRTSASEAHVHEEKDLFGTCTSVTEKDKNLFFSTNIAHY